MNYAAPYLSVKTVFWKLLKSLAVPGSVVLDAIDADECTQRQKSYFHWSFVLIQYSKLGLLVTNCYGEWNLGPPFLPPSKMQSLDWCHMTSTRKKEFKSALSAGKIGCSLVEWGICFSCKLLAWKVNIELWLLYSNTKKSECLPLLGLSNKKIVWSIAHPWQREATLKCTHHWDHHTIWVGSVAASTLHPWPHTISVTCLVLCKMAWNDTVTQTRHCRTLYQWVQGKESSITGQDYSFVF